MIGVSVGYAPASVAFGCFEARVRALALGGGTRRVCEIGAGANPLLALDFLADHGLDCLLLDSSADELDKAPAGYRRLHADIVSPRFIAPPQFDLVFSRVLAEHVPNPSLFHRRVASLLRPGGLAAHFFPTLYWPPFVVNRLLPGRLSAALLSRLQPGREPTGRHGKFPAHYRWCRGPSQGQIARLRSTGFEVLEYDGFFGQPDYVARIPPLVRLDRLLTQRLLARPRPWLTSYAYVVMARPA